jgi:hypothetical protein
LLMFPVQAEPFEEVVNAAPRWEVVRKQAPRTAAPYDIEDDVKDLAQRIDPRSPIGFGGGKVGFQASPLGIREVG